jgi:hypothetical protein
MIPFLKLNLIGEYSDHPLDNKLKFYLIYTGQYFDLLLVMDLNLEIKSFYTGKRFGITWHF